MRPNRGDTKKTVGWLEAAERVRSAWAITPLDRRRGPTRQSMNALPGTTFGAAKIVEERLLLRTNHRTSAQPGPVAQCQPAQRVFRFLPPGQRNKLPNTWGEIAPGSVQCSGLPWSVRLGPARDYPTRTFAIALDFSPRSNSRRSSGRDLATAQAGAG